MAKLILYSPYYKATDYRMGKYVRYIATREGVELPRNTKLKSSATKKQKNLIENMLKDFPNCNELLEYKDYLDKPTIENASEFITRVLETNVQSESMGGYVKYMATRPGAERIAEHGLFSDNNTPIVLSKIEQELSNYEGNVWTHIISLKREDAARLGFDNVKAWQSLLTAKRNEIAMYSLACQYLFSDKFKDKIKDGLELLDGSANKNFAPAEKMLAFIILKGELLPKDEKRAYNLLLHSASLGDDKAEYALAKLLLNSEVIQKDTERAIKLLISAIDKNNEWAKVLLGKMLLFGIDISKDEEKGIELLQSAAEQGNEYAAVILQNRGNYLKYVAAMSTMRLFGYMGNLFGKKFNTDKSKIGFRIDKKQYAQIQEKKMAQGLRS